MNHGGKSTIQIKPIKLTMKTNLLFYPCFSGQPYYRCLYETFNRNLFNIRPGTVDEALQLAESGHNTIFHIHHLNMFFNELENGKNAWTRCSEIIHKIDALKARNVKIIWTVHNKISHEGMFPEQELRLSHFLSCVADIVHIHSHLHLPLLQELLHVDENRIVISRHGNWFNIYGTYDINDRIAKISDKSAAFVGQLRSYKNIDNILEIVCHLDKEGYETIIAGKPSDKNVEQFIKNNAPKNTQLRLKYLSPYEIHEICSHYNIGILSYTNILTSGTLMLYLSYGMNIIATPLSEGEGGHALKMAKIYDADASGLQELVSASPQKLVEGAMRNYQTAAIETWDTKLAGAVEKLVGFQTIVVENCKSARHEQTGIKICARPFYHFEISPAGIVYPCCPAMCRHYSLGKLQDNSLDEIWRGPKAERFREMIARNDYSECDLGLCTHYDGKTWDEIQDLYYQDGKIRAPQMILISYDSECNLVCQICRDKVFLNKTADLEHMSNLESLYFPLIPEISTLYISGSGDPFGSKYALGLIQRAKEVNPHLKFDFLTNGLMFTPGLYEKIGLEGKIGSFWVSIHAARSATYRLITRNGVFERLKRNMAFCSSLLRSGEIHDLAFNFVVCDANYKEMPEFAEMALSYGARAKFWVYRKRGGEPFLKDFGEHAVWHSGNRLHGDLLEVLTDKMLKSANCGFDGILANLFKQANGHAPNDDCLMCPPIHNRF